MSHPKFSNCSNALRNLGRLMIGTINSNAMSEITPFEDSEEFRDHIATVDEKGKRIWIYPKKPKRKIYFCPHLFKLGLF